jgi:multicomponent Na+:H+ antiporter subunit E
MMLRVSARAAVLALFWWVLTGGNLESWVVGAPVVLLATVSSLLLSRRVRHHWRLTGLIGFVPFFFWRSFCGSIDVARRALLPKVLLEPAFMDYSLSLPDGVPRLFMANVVSLLPGTLSAELLGDCLKVHVLDDTAEVCEQLQSLESRVAGLFALEPLRGVDSGDCDCD